MFFRILRSEVTKLCSGRLWWTTVCLLLVVQPLLSLLAARGALSIGLDATPETHPELIEAFPPLQYFGFEELGFGILFVGIFGGITGAADFKHHNLRTGLLGQSSRLRYFWGQTAAFLCAITGLSLVSVPVAIVLTHLGLGDQGLSPVMFGKTTWQFIGYTVVEWILLGLLAFALGRLFRTAFIPLAFLIPQVYNFGLYLEERWSWAANLPVAAGCKLTATPETGITHDPVYGGVVLMIWISVTLAIGWYLFSRKDVGGGY